MVEDRNFEDSDCDNICAFLQEKLTFHTWFYSLILLHVQYLLHIFFSAVHVLIVKEEDRTTVVLNVLQLTVVL